MSGASSHHHDINMMTTTLGFLLLLSVFLQQANAFVQPTLSSGVLKSLISNETRNKPPTRLYSVEKKAGTARFTGMEEATGGLDFVLSAISSDVGSIALGLIGLLIVVTNRLAHQDELAAEALGQETRSDLLAVFACGAVLLNGISKLDVTSALADTVVLDGVTLDEPFVPSSSVSSNGLLWAIDSVLEATPAKTVVLLMDESVSWKTVVLAGTAPHDPSLRTGTTQPTNPILDGFRRRDAGEKAGDTQKRTETYLPTLQALPGKVEFTYLPVNTQEALLLPVNDKTVLVLGSDTAKSFTPRDIAWCQVLAKRMNSLI